MASSPSSFSYVKASSFYHDNHVSGLCLHSLAVTEISYFAQSHRRVFRQITSLFCEILAELGIFPVSLGPIGNQVLYRQAFMAKVIS